MVRLRYHSSLSALYSVVNSICGRFLAIYHIHHCISFTLTSTVFLKFSIWCEYCSFISVEWIIKSAVAILLAIGIAKIYKKLQRTENIYTLSARCNFCLFIFLFWQVISPFVFYNDSVNRKEMNFHEKQIPQLYWKLT